VFSIFDYVFLIMAGGSKLIKSFAYILSESVHLAVALPAVQAYQVDNTNRIENTSE
jgi:hypothetical protein